jgi:transposase
METIRMGVAKVDASGRRWYTAKYKSEIVGRCLEPDASVSRVSILHGLNTNLVRKWIRKAQSSDRVDREPLLLPVTIEENAPIAEGADEAIIEIHVGAAIIRILASAGVQQITAVVRALR